MAVARQEHTLSILPVLLLHVKISQMILDKKKLNTFCFVSVLSFYMDLCQMNNSITISTDFLKKIRRHLSHSLKITPIFMFCCFYRFVLFCFVFVRLVLFCFCFCFCFCICFVLILFCLFFVCLFVCLFVFSEHAIQILHSRVMSGVYFFIFSR